jgi:hypothetical protein
MRGGALLFTPSMYAFDVPLNFGISASYDLKLKPFDNPLPISTKPFQQPRLAKCDRATARSMNHYAFYEPPTIAFGISPISINRMNPLPPIDKWILPSSRDSKTL